MRTVSLYENQGTSTWQEAPVKSNEGNMKDMDTLKQAQQRATEMKKVPVVGRARRAGTLQPGEEKAQWGLANVYKCLV